MAITSTTLGTRIVFTSSGDGVVQQKIRKLQVQVEKLEKALEKSNKTGQQGAKKTGQAFDKVTKGPLNRFGRAIKNVFAISLAFEFIRAVAFIEQAFTDLIKTGN